MKLNDVYFAPPQINSALLLLRVLTGFSLFVSHGIEKITGFSKMAAHFPDPLHIGPVPSLAFAVLSDAICSILIMLGLGTRVAAAVVALNLLVAFTLVHHFALSGQRSGELAWVYLSVAIVLVLTGAGRYSLDGLIHRRSPQS